MNKECLECGMMNSIPTFEITDWNKKDKCLKCDSLLILQSDGSTHTRDIAHGNETIEQALVKLNLHLNDAINNYTRRVRLIVGGGLIKEEVLGLLYFYKEQHYILSYSVDSKNAGVIMVNVRH